MDWLYDLFSAFCGQGADRCFVLSGRLLPICQRCLGLYCGLLIGVALASVVFPRAAVVPGGTGKVFIGIAIACMFVMGFHFVDPGPITRFVSGYVYGYALIWLVHGIAKGWFFGRPYRTARFREELIFIGLSGVLCALLVFALEVSWDGAFLAFAGLALLGWLALWMMILWLVIGRVLCWRRETGKNPENAASES